MTSNPTRELALRLAGGAVAGAVALAALSAIALAADNESMAKGIVTGGSLAIATVIVLNVLAHRRRHAPAESRLVAGKGDERERALAMRAIAHAALVMYAVAVGCTFGVAFGMAAEAALACVMFSGLLAAGLSFIVSVRRD